MRRQGLGLATLIHPAVHRSSPVQVGEGSVIMRSLTLTLDIRLGDHVLLSPGCAVGHDTVVGRGCSLMPEVHLAGRVNVELSVRSDVVLGAGAVVIDVPPAFSEEQLELTATLPYDRLRMYVHICGGAQPWRTSA